MPTPTGSPSRIRTAQQKAAEEVVTEYFRLKSELRKDPSQDIGALEAIVNGDKPAREVEMIQEKRENGIVQVGDAKLYITGSKLLERSRVEVSACTDASDVDLKNTVTGESISDPSRPRYVSWTITVTEYNEQWYVADFSSQAGEPCE